VPFETRRKEEQQLPPSGSVADKLEQEMDIEENESRPKRKECTSPFLSQLAA
jgi:hypothetical protein